MNRKTNMLLPLEGLAGNPKASKSPRPVVKTAKKEGGQKVARKRLLYDISGKKFNFLTAIKRVDNRGRHAAWLFRCDCGVEKELFKNTVCRGLTKSCGCMRWILTASKMTTHGHRKHGRPTAEYRTWRGMKTRCLNSADSAFKRYGGRGIKICKRWMNSFHNFLSDMGIRPSTKHSLHRIDNDGNYCPSNCKWATTIEQAKWRRNNVWIKVGGKKYILAEAKLIFGVNKTTLADMVRSRRLRGIMKFMYREKLVTVLPRHPTCKPYKIKKGNV
jgi:hypothetical protein